MQPFRGRKQRVPKRAESMALADGERHLSSRRPLEENQTVEPERPIPDRRQARTRIGQQPPSAAPIRNVGVPTFVPPSELGRLFVPQRQHVLESLQRGAGNSAVQRLLDGGRALQRHPEGAPISADPAGELEGASPDAPVAGISESAIAASSSGATAGLAESESVSGEQAEVETPQAEDGKDKKPPAPAKPNYLDLATAQTVLQKTYGKVKKITTGNIVFLESREDTWAKYDELCIDGNVKDWKKGDAKKRYPLGLNGFNWKGTSYINKASALSTTTPHEMLHGNTADGFRAAVGETLNEGVTQYFTLKALKDSSIDPPKSIPYADEVEVATALIALIGEQSVIDAYFKGGDSTKQLIEWVDLLQGKGTFAKIKEAGDKKEWQKAKDLLKKVAPPKTGPSEMGDFPTPAGSEPVV
jgi:hypothetical protein